MDKKFHDLKKKNLHEHIFCPQSHLQVVLLPLHHSSHMRS